MATKTFTVKNGERIVVQLAGKKEREKPRPKKPAQKSSGIVEVRREDEYLARRKSGVYLNFYDLGWRENNQITFTPRFANAPVALAPVQDDYDDRDSSVFALALDGDAYREKHQNLSEFIEEFRPDLIDENYFPANIIVNGPGFNYDMSEFAADETRKGWTPEKGLKLRLSEASAIYLTVIFRLNQAQHIIDLKASNHITDVYDRNAPNVELPLKSGSTLDVYFLPDIFTLGARLREWYLPADEDPVPTDSEYTESLAQEGIVLEQRANFYDRMNANFKKAVVQDLIGYNQTYTDEKVEKMSETVEVLASAFPAWKNSKLEGERNDDPPPLYNETRTDDLSMTTFFDVPTPPLSTEPPAPDTVYYFGTLYQSAIYNPDIENLQAIIYSRQKRKFYYYWE